MSGNRVLTIDDEKRVLEFVSRALESEGLDVTTADTGEEGFRLAVSRAYDVVILDLLMPGTDGFSVLQRILRRRPQQAVIVLSCLTDTRSKVRCLEMGAEDYLAKPFALDELLARVKARLWTRSAAHPDMLQTRGLLARPGSAGG